MRSLVVVFAIAACGKSANDRPAADKSSPPPASIDASPMATPDAAARTPADAGPPTPEDRAHAAIDEAAAVLDAFTAAIGKDRCSAKQRIADALAANADHIKHVQAELADPAVKAVAEKVVPSTKLKASTQAWMQTQIDGTCKVDADILVVNKMLAL